MPGRSNAANGFLEKSQGSMEKRGYSISDSGDVTIIRLHRDFELPELLAMIDDVAQTTSGDHRIWDLGDYFSFTGEQIRQIADYGKNAVRGPCKIAYVAPNDLTFGLLRMYEVYRSEDGVQAKVFRTEADATDWLNQNKV
ncbi:MAG: hypothetical protein ABJ322_07125 [Marinobacter sp.]|uniref:hypothetical protein n=1 Tax=Marinobacter sp. TaxID=50741 RepID=UPI00329A2EFB